MSVCLNLSEIIGRHSASVSGHHAPRLDGAINIFCSVHHLPNFKSKRDVACCNTMYDSLGKLSTASSLRFAWYYTQSYFFNVL